MPVQINTYQLSGLDDRERGFTRQVEVSCHDNTYQAVLRYERFRADGSSRLNEAKALENLIQTLQAQGYTQLRSQLIFRGKSYLGSQELWIDYSDAEVAKKPWTGFWESFQQWLKNKRKKTASYRNPSRC